MEKLVATAAAKVLKIATEKALREALNLGWKRIRWLPITMIRAREEVRVSCSAFLRVQDENDRYLLVQNLHRPDFYGPPGGCYKYFNAEGKPALERFFYRADPATHTAESDRDLRGYIRRKSAARFFEWFVGTPNGRESARECLIREIREEFVVECKGALPQSFDLSNLDFQYVRCFLERSKVSGTKIPQFRHYEIYDLDFASQASRLLRDWIKKMKNRRILWVSRDEIETGRHGESKSALGHVAVLFVNDQLTRPDMPSHRTR